MKKNSLLLAFSGLLFLAAALNSFAQPTVFTFTNSASTNWFAATNWSPVGIPGSADTAVITNGTVGLSSPTSVATLNLVGGTLKAPFGLTLLTGGNWTGGSLQGLVTVAPAAGFNLNNTNQGGTLDLPNATLLNYGTVTWSAGTLRGNSSTIVTNFGTWMVTNLNDQFNNNLGGTPAFYNNNSFIVQTAHSVTFSGVVFSNNAVSPNGVRVTQGTFLLADEYYLSGSFQAALGATITLQGTCVTAPNLQCTGPGTVQFSSGTLLLTSDQDGLALTGGTVTLGPSFQNNGNITNLTLAGSTLAGTNTLLGVMNWKGGSITGVFSNAPTGVLYLNGSAEVYLDAALTNAGQIIWNGSGSWEIYNNGSQDKGQINNLTGGLIDVQCNNTLANGGGSESINNSGLFRKSMSTNTTYVEVMFTNNATGTVAVESGHLQFTGSATGNFGGTFLAANGTSLTFYDGGIISGSFTAGFGAQIGFSSGTFTETATATFGGAGTVFLNGGALTLPDQFSSVLQLNAGAITLPSDFQGGTITNLSVNGVTLTGTNTVTGVLNLSGTLSGPLTIASGGVVNWTQGNINGAINIQAGGTLNIGSTGNQGSCYGYGITNAGMVNWLGGFVAIRNNTTFYNEPGAVFSIQCNNQTFQDFNGLETFYNAGLVQKIGSTGPSYLDLNFTNTGVVVAQTGTIAFSPYNSASFGGSFLAASGATLLFNNGGSLTGDFTAAAGGTIQLNGGTFTPGPALVFNGPGTNYLSGGTLLLAGDLIPNLVLTGGTVQLTPAFEGGTISNLMLNGASLAGTNIVSGTLNLYGNLNGPLTVLSNATLNLGGSVNGLLTLMPGATFNWTNGTLYYPLTIPTNAVMNLPGPGTIYVYDYSITNAGTINWSGGSIYDYYYYYATAIYNQAGAVFNLESNVSGSGVTFNNAGTFRKSQGAGSSSLSWTFNNTGLVDVQTGTLNLQGPIQNTDVSGTYIAEAGATINFSDGGYLTGEFTAQGGATMNFSSGIFTNTTSTLLDGAGTYNLVGATFNLLYSLPSNLQLISGNLNPGPLYQGGSIGTLNLNDVGIAGTNVVTGALTVSNATGEITVAANGTLTVNGDVQAAINLQPGATFNWTGQYPSLTAPINVAAGAVWNISIAPYAYIEAPVTNAGTINWQNGAIYLYNDDYAPQYYYEFNNGSIFNLAGATFNVLTDQPVYSVGGGYASITSAGTFRKAGSSGANDIEVLFTNTGVIDVESGTLEFNNNFTQSGGTWDIALGGLMAFEDPVTLPNTLNVTAPLGFIPPVTNFISIVDYPSYSGSIGTTTVPADGASWQLSFGDTALSLIVTNQPLPAVTIVSPTNNAPFTAPAAISLSAAGTVANSGITGFGGSGMEWTLNQSPNTSDGPDISGNLLHLTHSEFYEGGTAFYDLPQPIGNFTASFTYHLSTSGGPADGFAFVMQNEGLNAVGGYGLNLGFGNAPSLGISPGAAVLFNIFTGYGLGTKYATGTSNYVNSGYQSVSPVNLDSTDPLNITISYNGSLLTEILLDTITGAGFTNTYAVNLVSDVGGSTAYVGFSAGTGAGYSTQDISDFLFTSSQPDPNLASVQFYQGTTLLGSGALQAGQIYNYNWNSVPAGNYSVTAVAADSFGNTATSAPVNITVYAPGLQPLTYTWTGAVSSDWFTAGNWSPNGVPAGRDNAIIANGGTAIISHPTGVTNLVLSSGTIGGNAALTVSNFFNWQGGAVTNALVIPTNGTLVINSTSLVSLPNATVLNQGTVLWVRGAISGNPQTIITNGASGLWLIQTDNQLQLGVTVVPTNGLFVNNGIVRKTVTTGSTQFKSENFINNGTVDAQSGVIILQSGGILSGTYNTAANGYVEFGSGPFTLDALPVITGSGVTELAGGTLTMVHTAAPALKLASGTIVLGTSFQNGTITNLTVAGASLSGTATVTGTLNFQSGAVVGGALTVAPTGLLVVGTSNFYGSLTLSAASLVNAGEILWQGGYIYNGTSPFTNNNLLLVQGGYYLYGGLFVNNGVIKQTSASSSYIENVPFINNGTVDAEAGTINLTSGGTFAGTYYAAAGASIAFAGGNNTLVGLPNFNGLGSYIFNGGTLLLTNDIDPALQLEGGTVVLTSTFQNHGSINNLVLNGATLIGTNTVSGSLTVTGGEINGPLTINSNANVNFNPGFFYLYGTASITNFGSVFCSGSTCYFYPEINGVPLVNDGLWLDQGTSGFSGNNTGFFINNGIYRKEGSTGTTYFDISFTNNGLVDLRTGYIDFENGGALGGTFNAEAQTIIYFDGGSYTPGIPSALFTGAGTVQFDYGNITLTSDAIPSLPLNSGNVTLGANFQRNGAITNLTLTGATLVGTNLVAGSLTLTNGSQITGSLTVLPNALLTISGQVTFAAGASIINNGVVDWTGGTIYTYPSTVISNTGLWLTETDSDLYNEDYNYYYNQSNTTFVNAGTFIKTSTTGTTPFYGVSFLNSGTLDVESGTMNLSYQNNATNVPYEQTGATLIFGASAPNLAGRLILSSNISLDGTLELNPINGYVPNPGDEFSLINYGTNATLAFSSLVLPPLASNTRWDVENGLSAVILRIVPTAGSPATVGLSGTVSDQTTGNPIAGVTVYASETGASNLIVNGSFETPSIVNQQYVLYSPGSTGITGWTVVGPTNDNVDLAGNDYGPSEDGSQFFDPTGTTGGAGLTQTFPTVPGMTYELVFYHGGFQHYALNAVLGVTVGTNYYTFGETDGVIGNLDWRREQIFFVAPGSQTTLTFSEITGFNSDDNFVDNVQVIPPGLGTIIQAVTGANGAYQMTVPTGTYQVGVDGLPTAGFNNVANQSVQAAGPNSSVNFSATPLSAGQYVTINTAVNPSALGTASGGGNGFRVGTPVIVSVTQNANALPYYFAGWMENGVLESTNFNYSFTAYRSRNLVATFALPGLLVTASNNVAGDGQISGAGIYLYNATNILRAFPYPGFTFVNWTSNGVVVGTSNTLVSLVQTNFTIVANFGDANPSHVVAISSSPAGLTSGTGAGTYTNGQTAIITAPAGITNHVTNFYVFQGFTLNSLPVTSLNAFSKSFSTFDATNLPYVANYQLYSLQPRVVGVSDNYPNPIPATTGFILTFQFDRSMRSSPTPLVVLSNSNPKALNPTVGANGLWSTTVVSNDTYQTPGITFGSNMDGNVSVIISRVQDIYGHALLPTNVLALTVHSTPPPPPLVAITSPTNNTQLTSNTPFAITGTATSPTNTIASISFLANGAPINAQGTVASPFSFTVNGGLPNGSFDLQAVAVDSSGLSATSAVMHIMVAAPGSTLIDFETLNTSNGLATGIGLSNYLAGFGVKATNVTTGTKLAAANGPTFLGGGVVQAFSGTNFLIQTGANGAVSYKLVFNQPYASVSWVRPLLLAGNTGASLPAWRAHIFDSQGNELGSAGEAALGSFTNIPAAHFTLLGSATPNIASIRFDGNNQGVSSLSTLPLDDLLLSLIPVNTTLAVTLSPIFPVIAPGQITVTANVTDTVATVSQVNFYEGSNFISAMTPVNGAASVTLNDLAQGSYIFTAVAADTFGTVSSSAPLTVVVSPVTGLNVINFDSLSTAAGSVTGATVSNYLAGYGVGMSNVTLGTSLEVVNGGFVAGAGGAVASSPPNYFTQAGLSQPVSFTLTFKSPLQAFGFTRVPLLAGAAGVSHPQWQATLLDAKGNVLGSAGESLIASLTNVPANSFLLTGLPNDPISAVRFDSDSMKTAAFSAVLLDDLILNGTTAPPIASTLTVTLTSPAPGAALIATQPITLGASVVDTAGTVDHVSFFVGATLVGSVSSSPYSYIWTSATVGSNSLRAEVVDVSGTAAYSAPQPIIIGAGQNETVINFDALNATKAPVSGAALNTYLATNGVAIGTNLTAGTTVAVENQATINSGTAVAASSPPNIITQTGSSGPVSYTVNFANPLTNFEFTRPELLASPFVSHPAWQATAFDAAGVAVTNVSESLIGSYTNVGAQAYTLSGPGIASVQFSSQGSGLTTFNAMLADDFVLTTNAAGITFPPAIAITSPVSGLQASSPVTLAITAQAVSSSGIASVSFFANGVLLSNVTSAPYTAQLFAPAAAGYALTAVALGSNGLSRTSPVVNVTVLPPAFVFGFATQPVSQRATLGSSVTFSVTTTGTNTVAFQWYQNGTAVVGQTNSSITVFPVTADSAGGYYVTATGGGTTLTSSTATLTVAQPPTIVTQPASQTVAIGSTFTLTVAASGTGPFIYQWLLNGSVIPGPTATNSTYSITNAQPLSSGNYQVIVANAKAFVVSAAAQVLVQPAGGAVASADNFSNRVTINPLLGPVTGNNVNATAEPGEPQHDGKPGGKSIWYTWTPSFTGVVSLTTEGSDFDTLLAIYTGTNVAKLTPIAADDDSGGFFTSLVTFNVTAGAAYQIAVDGFKGAAGNVVLGLPAGTGYRVLNPSSGSSVPAIAANGQPTNQLVAAGAKVTLTVHATSTTPISYQWFFQGAPVGTGGTASSLILNDFQASSVGQYYVLVVNSVGSVQSESASVEIEPANQQGSGGSSQDKFGQAVDLAGGTAATTVTKKPASGGGDTRGFSVSQVFSTVGGSKEPGEENHCGQSGGASQWFVYTAPGSGTLDVNTIGSSYNTIIAIYTNNGTVVNFTNLSPVACGFTTNFQLNGQPNVIVPNVVQGTRYYIAVDGYQGASGTVQFHIGLGVPPSLATLPSDQFVVAGSNATFSVVASGTTNFGYQWQFNGANIAKATNANYTVTNAQATAVGSYTVVVSNIIGNMSSPPAILTLQYAPKFTVEPTNDTVEVGQKAGFAATVVGVNVKTNPLVLQWFEGNDAASVAIPKATNATLLFPITQYSNNGSYFLVASNSYGVSNSTVVVLTVNDTNAPKVAFTAPINGFSSMNNSITVTGTASDNVGVSLVQVQVGSGAFQTATGTTKWTNVVALAPGTNIITAQSVDLAGNVSGSATLHLVYIATSLLVVEAPVDGKLITTTGATNGANLILGRNYTITASPATNYIFANWSSGTSLGMLTNRPDGSNLTFLMFTNMVLQANFVTNPFLAVAGVYNGLFYPLSGVTEASSGFFSATVTSNHQGTAVTYSAKLLLDGGSNAFSGTFDLTGASSTNLARKGKSSVMVSLNLDLNAADAVMTGSVSNDGSGVNAVLHADRAIFNTNTAPASDFAGKFTLLLPPAASAPLGSPDGFGYAAITNTLGGVSTLGGALADGTAFLQSVPIGPNGNIPIYQSLYAGGGSIMGWIYFTNEPPQNISSANSWFSWIKPAVAKTLYPLGFTTFVTNVLGSPYTNMEPEGVPVLNLPNGTLVLSNGNVANGTLTFNNLNTVRNALTNLNGGTAFGPTNYLVLSVNTNNGVVTVTFRATGEKTNTIAHGAVLQNQTSALGAFPGTNQTGSFNLQEAAPAAAEAISHQ